MKEKVLASLDCEYLIGEANNLEDKLLHGQFNLSLDKALRL